MEHWITRGASQPTIPTHSQNLQILGHLGSKKNKNKVFKPSVTLTLFSFGSSIHVEKQYLAVIVNI